MKNLALHIAGTLFALVSIAHWTRFFLDIGVVVGDYAVPVFLSLPIGIVTALLAAWMFVAARDSKGEAHTPRNL